MGAFSRFKKPIIGQIREDGITILLIEQNANAALTLGDYGYVMETGKVVLEDNALNLLENPKVKEAYLGQRKETCRIKRTKNRNQVEWRS